LAPRGQALPRFAIDVDRGLEAYQKTEIEKRWPIIRAANIRSDKPPTPLTFVRCTSVLELTSRCDPKVSFGSLADIAAAFPNVRFTPESRHHRETVVISVSKKRAHAARCGIVRRCLVAARINDGPCKAPRVGKAKFVTTWNLD
jgi:hypothetical protein